MADACRAALSLNGKELLRTFELVIFFVICLHVLDDGQFAVERDGERIPCLTVNISNCNRVIGMVFVVILIGH